MPKPMFLAGVVALFLGFFLSRHAGERSLRVLSDDEKLRLLEGFSQFRVYGALPMLFIVAACYGLRHAPRSMVLTGSIVCFLMFVAYFTVMHFLVIRRLRALEINAVFLRAHVRARLISYAGFLVFFTCAGLSALH